MTAARVRPLIGALLLVAAAATATVAQGRPDILLITVDTLRPDAIGTIGGANATPNLDALFAESALFTGAVSPLPLTLPAHTSILTGLLPRRHGVRDNGRTVPASLPTLAGELAADGYTTAAFVSGFPLEGLFGLDSGFDHYDDELPGGREGHLERAAGDTVAALAGWLASAPRPWFAWVHFYDPHDPYEPPRAFWGPGPRGGYDGEVRYVDDEIGRLLELVATAAPGERLTVVTADHGEGLGDHAEKTHGYFLYDSTMLVPLAFHLPGRVEARRSAAPVRLIDIYPTILELVGAGVPPAIDGRSLVALLDGDEGTDEGAPPAYLETRLPWTYFGWSPLAAWRTEDWKLIEAPAPELYDLKNDPAESSNVVDARRALARDLARAMKAAEGDAAAAATVQDDEARTRLRALGYLAVTDQEPPSRDLPDPKHRLELRDKLTLAEDLLANGGVPQAAALFEEVLAIEPNNRAALLRSGVTALRRGELELAITRLTRSVELDPDRAEARFALGDALMRQRRFSEAASHWVELARLQPRRVEAWANLGQASCLAGDSARGPRAWREALALVPDDAQLWCEAALCEFAGGRRDEAALLVAEGLASKAPLEQLLAASSRCAPLAQFTPALEE